MRIGIDCRTILNPERGEGAGVGHYTYQLIKHLIKIDHQNEYYLFFDRTVQSRRLEKFRAKNVRFKFSPFIQYSRFLPNSYAHYLVSAFLSTQRLTVFHSPTLSLPQSYKSASVVTAHDLAAYKIPDICDTKQVPTMKKTISQAVKQAKIIIAVSQATKKDLMKIFGTEEEKIKVIYHGIDKRFFKKSSAAALERIRMKLNIKDDYLLFFGRLETRKNVLRIIEAYERLRERMKRRYQLVLAGAPGFGFEEIKKRAHGSKYQNDIILSGRYLEPENLDPLFEGAKIFVSPALCEGFGLTITEAMANGRPVITSNLSSMPEITGGKAMLIDPLNVSEITQAMFDLLTKKELWENLSQEGKKRVEEFDWEKTAEETLLVYQEAARS